MEFKEICPNNSSIKMKDNRSQIAVQISFFFLYSVSFFTRHADFPLHGSDKGYLEMVNFLMSYF